MADVPVIRPAEVGDAERIGLIHVRSWQSAYRGKVPQDYLDGLDPAVRTGRWRRGLETIDRARRFYAKAGRAEDGAVKSDDNLGFTLNEIRYRRALSPAVRHP